MRWLPFLAPAAGEEFPLPTKIDDDCMSLEIDGSVLAAAKLRDRGAVGGRGAWTVSSYPGRLFTRDQAITAMVLAERLAAGFGGDDLFVLGWQEELGLA
jgi:hypothetical protein